MAFRQQELQKLARIFQKQLILKNFQSKLETFTKLKERIKSALLCVVIKVRKHIQYII